MSDFESDPNDPDFNWDDPDITDDKLDALKMERDVMELSHVQQVKKMLVDAAPQITMQMIALAQTATNENTRLNAGKYVLDKVLDPESEAGKGVLEDLVGDLVKNVEQFANAGPSSEAE